MITNEERFREELNKTNPWWVNKAVPIEAKKPVKRQIFKEILESMKLRRATIVIGPRRTGKTVLIKQLIQELIKKNSERNFLYYSLDDPSIFTYSNDVLRDTLNYFLENIALKGKKYVFLDEVHLYKDWFKWIKAYYDKEKDLKFVLTGSSSLVLQTDANKYLRGRTITFELFPLSFREFLELNGVKITEQELNSINASKPDYPETKKLSNKVKQSFNEFLLVGGFPEWFEVKNARKWHSMLIEDIPKKAIYEDAAKLYGVKNTKTLESILAFIVANQSRILSYESINEIAKLDHGTLLNYIKYITTAYLAIEILKYETNIKTQLKAMKKYLAIDQGLRNALLKEYEVKEDNMGLIIENIVGVHLFKTAKNKDLKLFYMKSNNEVDFLIKNKSAVPVEVKYKETVTKKDLKPLLKTMEKHKLKKGAIITKNQLKKEKIQGKEIRFIPAWQFLLTEPKP